MAGAITRSAIGAPTSGPSGIPSGLNPSGINHGSITSGISGTGCVSRMGYGVTVQDTNLKDMNSGFVANRAITNTLGAAFETTEDDDFFWESLIFSVGERGEHMVGSYQTHKLMTLSKLNAFLKSEEGRKKYGGERFYDDVFRDVQFVGQYATGSSEPMRQGRNERAITLYCNGRCHMPDLNRNQSHSTANPKTTSTSKEGDYWWFMFVRCKMTDEVKQTLEDQDIQEVDPARKVARTAEEEELAEFDRVMGDGDVAYGLAINAETANVGIERAQMEQEMDEFIRTNNSKESTESVSSADMNLYYLRDQHGRRESGMSRKRARELAGVDAETGITSESVPLYYWKIEICSTSQREKPPIHWYSNDSLSDDDYVGGCRFFMQIGAVYGDRNFDPRQMQGARNVIDGGPGYKENLVTLTKVEGWIGNY